MKGLPFLLPFLFLSSVLHAEPESLDSLLAPYPEKFDLPAIGAAVVKDGEIVALGVAGKRRIDQEAPVEPDDLFHLGSDGKSLTATLAAMLIEEGKFDWETTVAEALPDLADQMHPQFSGMTVAQLLSHSSGLEMENERLIDWIDSATLNGPNLANLDELRRWLILQRAPWPLDHEPGQFAYSNLGYTIVGHIIETKSGKTFEEVLLERVVDPMGLGTAGFGPQSTPGRTDAPLGHAEVDGKLKPLLAGPNGDNSPLVAPAGTLHMSLEDWAHWAIWNLAEGQAEPKLLSPENLKRLHTVAVKTGDRSAAAVGTPQTGGYAMGWGIIEREWANQPILYHGGSNGLNVAYIMLWPETDFGFVMVTNRGGKPADEALEALGEALYKKFAPKP